MANAAEPLRRRLRRPPDRRGARAPRYSAGSRRRPFGPATAAARLLAAAGTTSRSRVRDHRSDRARAWPSELMRGDDVAVAEPPLRRPADRLAVPLYVGFAVIVLRCSLWTGVLFVRGQRRAGTTRRAARSRRVHLDLPRAGAERGADDPRQRRAADGGRGARQRIVVIDDGSDDAHAGDPPLDLATPT